MTFNEMINKRIVTFDQYTVLACPADNYVLTCGNVIVDRIVGPYSDDDDQQVHVVDQDLCVLVCVESPNQTLPVKVFELISNGEDPAIDMVE